MKKQNTTVIYNSDLEDHNIMFDTIQSNLNIETKNKIIAIATLGLWNGNRPGYKILDNNLKNILGCDTSIDSFILEYDYDAKDLIGTGYHHDGINYYTFREIKDNVDIDEYINILLNNNKIDDELMDKYTNNLSKYLKPGII